MGMLMALRPSMTTDVRVGLLESSLHHLARPEGSLPQILEITIAVRA